MQILAGGAHGQVAVQNAALLAEGVRQVADVFRAAFHHDHFGADVMAQMHMRGGQYMVMAVVLNVGDLLAQFALVMIIDQGDRTENFGSFLPLFGDDFIPDQVSDVFRPVFILRFLNHFLQGFT